VSLFIYWQDVRQRITSAKVEDIETKEWDNISKFLRTSYSTAERDMKAVAQGIFDKDNQQRALKDVEQVKKYAQAGDVSVSQKDAAGLAAILGKMDALVDEFLDALSDVPDEI
jgi:hypothetical protein